MYRRILALAICLMTALPAAAQLYSLGSEPAGVRWYQIKTTDYKVIFPQGLDSLARVYAAKLEAVKMPVGRTAGYYPNQMYRRKLPVVLHPWNVTSNGMVAWTPNRMELLTTPDATSPMPQPWEDHLITHESRHVAQGQFTAEPRYRPASYVLGQFTEGAMSALYCGPSFYEGDAVAAETELSSAGRGRNASFLEYYRVAFRDGDTRNYYQWRYGSLKHYTPDYYAVGYIKMAGLRSISHTPDFTARYFQRIRDSKWPFPFFNMQGTVKDLTGKKFKEAFSEITDTLTARWNRDEAARAPFMPSEPVTSNRHHFTEYDLNCYLNGDLYSVRSGMTMAPQLVRIDSTGRVKYMAPFAYGTSRLKGDDKLKRLYWSETVSDARWDLKSWSEIWFFEPDRGRHKLTSRTRLFNPAPSPDGWQLATVEYPVQGGSALVVLGTLFGEEQCRITAPDGMQLVEPEWIGDNIYATAVTSGGFGIYHLEGDVWNLVLDCGPVNVKGLFARDGRLYFTSDLSGVDELYDLDLSDATVCRLTSSVQGGEDYRFSPDGGTLAFSVLTTGGRNLHLTAVSDLPEPVPADFSMPHQYEFAEELKTIDSVDGCSSVGGGGVPSGNRATLERYNRLAHLIRFHSWAPVYIDYDAVANMSFEDITTTAGIGASAFFQNHLGTMTGIVAYNADPGDGHWAHKAETKFTYSGIYPVIEAGLSLSSNSPTLYFLQKDFADFHYRLSLANEQIDDIPSFNASITAYIPWHFNSGGWYRGIIPQLRWNISNSLFTQGSLAPMNRLSTSLRAYAIRATPERRIYPALGAGIEAGWSGRPWAQNILSSCAYIYGYCYVPGLMDTHGIRFTSTIQIPTSDAIFNERYAVVTPRGMASYAGLPASLTGYKFQSRFTSDYAFPFAPLDWSGLGPVAYLRNFECTLHADYSWFKGDRSTKALGSVGADLCAVLGNLLWIPEDTRIGISYYYNFLGVPEGESPHYLGAVFNVDF